MNFLPPWGTQRTEFIFFNCKTTFPLSFLTFLRNKEDVSADVTATSPLCVLQCLGFTEMCQLALPKKPRHYLCPGNFGNLNLINPGFCWENFRGVFCFCPELAEPKDLSVFASRASPALPAILSHGPSSCGVGRGRGQESSVGTSWT